MEFFVTGLSHKTAPIEVRERLAFSGEALEVALSKLRRLDSVSEVVLVSTCNRTEIYGVAGDAGVGAGEVADWMAERSAADLGPHLYQKTGTAALTHLFRVASSLDSMVVGEPQILGQVKEAWRAAQEARNTGPRIERIFNRAFRIAKQVRSETGIGEAAVSMSFVAVELARRIFGSLEGRTILLVGAGKMSELAATHLSSNGISRVLVVNRSPERAKSLADRFGGEARLFAQLPELLETVDIVLSSTAAPGFVITRDHMARAIKARRYRPIFLIDLAVPRDIDPEVNDLDQVYAYDVDDMEKVVEENLRQRANEAARAEHMIRGEVSTFLEEDHARAVLPVIAALRHTASRVAEAEAQRTLSRLDGVELTDKQRDSVQLMAQAIVKRLLHEPTMMLRSSAGSGDAERLAAALTSLFGLDVDGINAAIAAEKAARRAEREAARAAEVQTKESGAEKTGEGAEATSQDTDGAVVPLDRRHG